MRPQIRALYPDLKNTDISGILAQKWHSASEEEKKPHLEKELREREKYHEDMAHWKEEDAKRQQEEKKKLYSTKNMVDFLDLPSSSNLWENLESPDVSDHENEGKNTNKAAALISNKSSNINKKPVSKKATKSNGNNSNTQKSKKGGNQSSLLLTRDSFEGIPQEIFIPSNAGISNSIPATQPVMESMQPKGGLKMNPILSNFEGSPNQYQQREEIPQQAPIIQIPQSQMQQQSQQPQQQPAPLNQYQSHLYMPVSQHTVYSQPQPPVISHFPMPQQLQQPQQTPSEGQIPAYAPEYAHQIMAYYYPSMIGNNTTSSSQSSSDNGESRGGVPQHQQPQPPVLNYPFPYAMHYPQYQHYAIPNQLPSGGQTPKQTVIEAAASSIPTTYPMPYYFPPYPYYYHPSLTQTNSVPRERQQQQTSFPHPILPYPYPMAVPTTAVTPTPSINPPTNKTAATQPYYGVPPVPPFLYETQKQQNPVFPSLHHPNLVTPVTPVNSDNETNQTN